jgi:hypothetical protein
MSIQDLFQWALSNLAWTWFSRAVVAIVIALAAALGLKNAFGLLHTWREILWAIGSIFVVTFLLIALLWQATPHPELVPKIVESSIGGTTPSPSGPVPAPVILFVSIKNSGTFGSAISNVNVRASINGKSQTGIIMRMPANGISAVTIMRCNSIAVSPFVDG